MGWMTRELELEVPVGAKIFTSPCPPDGLWGKVANDRFSFLWSGIE
jgi:hypothetical protein